MFRVRSNTLGDILMAKWTRFPEFFPIKGFISGFFPGGDVAVVDMYCRIIVLVIFESKNDAADTVLITCLGLNTDVIRRLNAVSYGSGVCC